MIKRLRIQDFMAHKDTEIELGPGVTVLTGPNNTGKSAVVEAIRSLAENPPPHHVIRHGASRAVVSVELDSGEVIRWVRSKNSTVYHLHRGGWKDGGGKRDEGAEGEIPADGVTHAPGEAAAEDAPEVYAKFGRTPPDDIRALLRLDPVQTESGPVDIHIGNQRYPIFLLDQTGSQAASFFAASTEAEYLLRMQQALKARTDQSRARRKELIRESNEAEKAVGRFEPLDGLEQEIGASEAMHGRITALRQSLPALERLIRVLWEAEIQHVRASRAGEVFVDLVDPPRLHETAGVELLIRGVEIILADITITAARTGALKPLEAPPFLHETASLSSLAVSISSHALALDERRRMAHALVDMRPPPDLHEVSGLEALVRDMEWTRAARDACAAREGALRDVLVPPSVGDVGPLVEIIGQLSAAEARHARCLSRRKALRELEAPPEPVAFEPLSALIASIDETEGRLRGVNSRLATLESLQPCREPRPLFGLEELIGRMERLGDDLKRNEAERQAVGRAIEAMRLRVEEAIAEAEACPLCGQMLDLEHFLRGAHA